MGMDSDRVKGPITEGVGKLKEEFGDATDDEGLEAEGQLDQVTGKLQNEWGEAKDAAREAVDEA